MFCDNICALIHRKHDSGLNWKRYKSCEQRSRKEQDKRERAACERAGYSNPNELIKLLAIRNALPELTVLLFSERRSDRARKDHEREKPRSENAENGVEGVLYAPTILIEKIVASKEFFRSVD